MNPQTERLFLAIWPDASLREQLGRHVEQWDWGAGAVRYASDDWHLTLHFLGALPLDSVDRLRKGLALAVTPFEMTLDQPQQWPHGLAILAPDPVPEALLQLQQSLAQALERLGLKVEARPFRPHDTLARRAADARPPDQPIEPIRWPVSSYVLARSTGDSQRRYEILQRYSSEPDAA